MIAYCWKTGLIEFGRRAPAGSLVIAEAPARVLRPVIEACAREGYRGHLLVPGVPEARNSAAALKAVEKWRVWVTACLNRRIERRAAP